MLPLRHRAVLAAGALVAAIAVAAAAPAEDAARAWQLLRLDHRISQADLDAIEATGAAAHGYVRPDGQLVWASAAEADRLSALGRVEPFEVRVHDGVRDEAIERVVVRTHDDARGGVISALAGIGELVAVRDAIGTAGLVDLYAAIPGAGVDVVAARTDVVHIGPAALALRAEDELSAQILAGPDGRDLTPGYREFLDGFGLDGAAVRVAVVDTGVDAMHPDLAGRVAGRVDYSLAPTGERHDAYGHGTHVAGIIAGNATGLSSLGAPVSTDGGGFEYGLGVAPAAEVVDLAAIGVTNPGWPPPYGFETITRDALDRGAAIWNASWTTGEGNRAGYVASAATLDALVRDADVETDGLQPFTMVFSAGNSGASGLTAPKEAKNLIVVASSDNARRAPVLGSSNQDIERISSFSSRGFANDGRIIPTVAAPGADIVSTRSSASAVCNLVPADVDGGLYAYCSGTSMAAPHVSGAVALLTQRWRTQFGRDPSPALSKALLVNTARDMRRADVPNEEEGWGRVDLGRLFAAEARLVVDQTHVLSDPGAVRSWQVDVADPSQSLRVTLNWTDVPAVVDAEVALVNDLDLEVVAPDGTVYRGNRFDDGFSLAGGEADRIDTLEHIKIRSPAAGTWTVRVRAHDLPGDGALGSGDATDQHFALVVANAS